MVEMAYGLQYKHDNHTTAINLIDVQLEKIDSQVTFAREQDRLEMIRELHAARVESLEMERFCTLNYCSIRSGEYSNPMKRQQKMTIHYKRHYLLKVRKTNYENRGAAAYDRNGPKKNQESRSRNPVTSDI